MDTSQQEDRLVQPDDSLEHNIRMIASYYPIGNVFNVESIGRGNSSSAMKLSCSTGSYIVRKLCDLHQAQVESAVATALTGLSISPPFIPTQSGQWYTKWAGYYYNVQPDWWDDSEQSLSLPTWTELGHKLATFHSISYDAKWPLQADRFDLVQQWKQLNEMSILMKTAPDLAESYRKLLGQLEDHLPSCLDSQQQYEGYIHGDLGIWNILITYHGAYLIDYGEVRLGHSHFDIAALAASAIDLSHPEYARQQWNSFCAGYEAIRSIHSQQLYPQLQLWMVRGAVSLLLHHGINERTLGYAQRLLNRIPALAAVICPASE